MVALEDSYIGPFVVTQLYLIATAVIITWLRKPLQRDEYELWHCPRLQRLYFERLKKQFNRLRAQVPKLDAIIEDDVEYKAIVALAASKRTHVNLAIGSHYIESIEPLHQWAVCNTDIIPNEVLGDVYHATTVLDKEFANNIVYNL